MRSLTMLLLLALASPGQERTVEQQIAEWIEQLHDADPIQRDAAVHKLAEQGRPAALVLEEMLRGSKPIDVALLGPLGRMGPDAVDCLPLLFDAFEKEKDEQSLAVLCRTILGIVPFMGFDRGGVHNGQALVMRAQETLFGVVRGAWPGEVHLQRVELAEALVTGTQGSYQVCSFQTDVPRLATWVDALGPGQPHARAQAAARWLGRAGSEGALALASLQRRLRQEPSGPLGNDLVVPFAEAILRIDPSGVEAVDAHTFLVEHGDTYQQQMSVLALRSFSDRASPATRALARIAEDPDTVKPIRHEALVTLGVIGPPAVDAIPTLEKLAGHSDRQIAERAKAALRQIKTRS